MIDRCATRERVCMCSSMLVFVKCAYVIDECATLVRSYAHLSNRFAHLLNRFAHLSIFLIGKLLHTLLDVELTQGYGSHFS